MNIGKSVVIKGELNGSEDLTIEGQVEGKIELKDHVLTIGPNGKIKAQVFAKALIVLGEVNGNVTASEKVDIRDGGSVDGDIVSPRVAIAEGAHFRGSVDMQRKARRSQGQGDSQQQRSAQPSAARRSAQPAVAGRAAVLAIADAREAEMALSDLFARRRKDDDGADAADAGACRFACPSDQGAGAGSSPASAAVSSRVLLDLGPVVGSNVTFFGEELGCKILVEDSVEGHRSARARGQARGAARLSSTSGSRRTPDTVDGILCWDIFDYLERPAAERLARQLTRMLRPDGVLLAFFSTADPRSAPRPTYTRHVVVDRDAPPAPAVHGGARQAAAAAEPRHPAAVRAAAHHRALPAQDQPARGAVPQARGRRRGSTAAPPGGTLSARGSMARPVIALLTDFGTQGSLRRDDEGRGARHLSRRHVRRHHA